MPGPRPLFGPSTLRVSETKSDLLQQIERAQLEILYRTRDDGTYDADVLGRRIT